MKASSSMTILGILLLIFGSIFALQGVGVIGGSVMTNNPFWIYAGSAIAVFGLIIAALGFWSGAKASKTEAMASTEKPT